MTYSYTQISQFLSCPRRYRYRYLDGWQEKETGAAMYFGRAFEQSLAALFLGHDSVACFYDHWKACREEIFPYPKGESWDHMYQSGVRLLERFAQDTRVSVDNPETNLQVKYIQPLSPINNFVSYIDAIGNVDGRRCLIDWKTTGSRFAEHPDRVLALDPQLVCYSWVTGIADVACVVFVRKRIPEIQYLHACISDDQRAEFAELVFEIVARIERGSFPRHAGIRFPNNGCISCAYVGLCLGDSEIVAQNLTRKEGAADLDWLNDIA